MLDITGGVELLFNADEKLTHYCVYSISPGKVSLVRFVHGQLQFLRNESVKPPAGFSQLRFSKRGIYYLLSFDTGGGTWGAPLGGDVFYSIPGRPFTNVVEIKEPDSGYVGIRAITGQLQTKSVVTRRVTLTTTANQMVLKPSGAAGTWNQTQVLPGAILTRCRQVPGEGVC